MKYVSIDIETTGLDSENYQVLSIGAIIEDTTKKLSFEEIPKFKAIILYRELTGSPYAINLNRDIISLIGDVIEGPKELKELHEKNTGYKFLEDTDVVKEFFDFLFLNGYGYDTMNNAQTVRFINGQSLPVFGSAIKPITINVAGKNFGTFDKLFLEKLPWWKKLIRTRSRIIDPAVLFCDWDNDESIPSLNECKVRAGISGEVSHDALEDAWDVIQVMRTKY